MSAEAPHPFDLDTALVPAGAGRWSATAPEHWFVGRGPNGGFLAALVARAAEAAAGRPLRSVTLHFLAAPGAGPLEVTAAVERNGRSFTVVSARIEQAGRPVTLALATLGALGNAGAEWNGSAPPAALPAAEAAPVPAEATGTPAFFRNYELRPALRAAGGEETGGWLRTAAPRALDAPLAVAMADAWMPSAFVALGRTVAAPTLDLTIHLRRPLPPPDMAPEDFVLVRFATRLSVAGVWEEDGELWTPGGELLAQSRQLALARELPARPPR